MTQTLTAPHNQPPTPDAAPADPEQAARPLIAAAKRLTRTLERASDAYRAGRLDAARELSASLTERVAAFETQARSADHTMAKTAKVQTALRGVAAATDRHAGILSALQNAASSLGEDARRMQRKRAGGGLYSALGAAPAGAGSGRILGKL